MRDASNNTGVAPGIRDRDPRCYLLRVEMLDMTVAPPVYPTI